MPEEDTAWKIPESMVSSIGGDEGEDPTLFVKLAAWEAGFVDIVTALSPSPDSKRPTLSHSAGLKALRALREAVVRRVRGLEIGPNKADKLVVEGEDAPQQPKRKRRRVPTPGEAYPAWIDVDVPMADSGVIHVVKMKWPRNSMSDIELELDSEQLKHVIAFIRDMGVEQLDVKRSYVKKN